MMDEVRVNIGGAEMELRPISARQYLMACAEAEKSAENFADDHVSKAILLGAALLAKGLFYDGEKIFSDGDEVLDALSADEIVETVGYIDLEPNQKEKIVETAEKVKYIGREGDVSENRAYTESVYTESQRVSPKEQTGIFASYTDTSVSVETKNIRRSYSPRSDMRRVSDFFQRDSRRYDDIISSY